MIYWEDRNARRWYLHRKIVRGKEEATPLWRVFFTQVCNAVQ
jgi:hypothetical protein